MLLRGQKGQQLYNVHALTAAIMSAGIRITTDTKKMMPITSSPAARIKSNMNLTTIRNKYAKVARITNRQKTVLTKVRHNHVIF